MWDHVDTCGIMLTHVGQQIQKHVKYLNINYPNVLDHDKIPNAGDVGGGYFF